MGVLFWGGVGGGVGGGVVTRGRGARRQGHGRWWRFGELGHTLSRMRLGPNGGGVSGWDWKGLGLKVMNDQWLGRDSLSQGFG